MIHYFLFDKEGYALKRNAVLLENTVSVSFDGAAEKGTLFVGDAAVCVFGGVCKFPVSYLKEGENCLAYSEGTGSKTKHFVLEPLYKWGNMAGVKALEDEKLAFSMLLHIRYIKSVLCKMEERIKKLEGCCFCAPLFENETKGDKRT